MSLVVCAQQIVAGRYRVRLVQCNQRYAIVTTDLNESWGSRIMPIIGSPLLAKIRLQQEVKSLCKSSVEKVRAK